MQTATVHMDFCYQTAFGVESPDAYEMLLLDVMQGEATLFIRGDEAEHAVAFDHADRRSVDQRRPAKLATVTSRPKALLKPMNSRAKWPPLATLIRKHRL